MIDEHITQFVGQPVVDFRPDAGSYDFGNVVYRFGYDWEVEVPVHEMLTKFFELPDCSKAQGLIIGAYDETTEDPQPVYDLILQNKEKLPNLRGLFLGEATQEESEISWIEHSDITPFFHAFPGLEDFRIRGASATMSPVRHIGLKTLVFESGGMKKGVLTAVHQSVFPELEHLEFYTGTDYYGWDGSAEDLKPFLYENPFPKLTYLGLRNCENADELAKLVASAPVLDQLEELDLSLGNLRDEGGRALLQSEGILKLKKLNLHHHYLSEEVTDAFSQMEIEVDTSGVQEPSTYGDEVDYYIAVTE